MKKVITYGTYDLLHHGHIRLLERAKALGDYLIVGVTSDDFDKARGKINVKQSLLERIEAVRQLNIADEIIVEEYEGQKIDDIQRYGVDVFTVGTDWLGKFDYLSDYCQVVYLDRTEGVSSTDERAAQAKLRIGIVGNNNMIDKFRNEFLCVNGIEIPGIYTDDEKVKKALRDKLITTYDSLEKLLEYCDAVYIVSHPSKHYEQIKKALQMDRHVLCESPVVLKNSQLEELYDIADSKGLVLMESIKTAYSTAYNRLLLLVKSGKIGNVVSVDATCTSLSDIQLNKKVDPERMWNSICAWGPPALLAVLQMLGVDYRNKRITSKILDVESHFDAFTKIDFIYDEAVASVKVGKAVKSEGELIISGDEGYIYVPAPWWKTDYFEVRFENQENNQRYFYQLEGEGIRYEAVAFVKSIYGKWSNQYISRDVTKAIVGIIDDYYAQCDTWFI